MSRLGISGVWTIDEIREKIRRATYDKAWISPIGIVIYDGKQTKLLLYTGTPVNHRSLSDKRRGKSGTPAFNLVRLIGIKWGGTFDEEVNHKQKVLIDDLMNASDSYIRVTIKMASSNLL